MRQLETQRLLLRQWRSDDFEPMAAFYSDEGMARFVGGVSNRDQTWRRLAAMIGHWQLLGFGMWAVEEKATRQLVGSVGLWRSAGWPELELGYWLFGQAHGKGYATEAGARARDCAFADVGSKTLVSYIHPDNEPSKRVAERLGAHLEETVELMQFGPHCIYRYPAP